MKDGSVYSASVYWVKDNKVHYILTTGAGNAVDLDEVDIERTTAENSKNGVRVTLKPRPGLSEPSPETKGTQRQVVDTRINILLMTLKPLWGKRHGIGISVHHATFSCTTSQ